MKHWRLAALAFLALVLAPVLAVGQSTPVIGPTTYTFTAANQSNVWTCNSGQSSFALSIPSGLSGTFTVTVAQTSSGTYNAPPNAYAPLSAIATNTVTTNGSNAGALTVALGSNYFVRVADTTYTSGSTTVTGSCSSAVPAPIAPTYPTALSGALVAALTTGHSLILTPSSASGCTSVETGAQPAIVLDNTGPKMTVFLELYDEGASPTCAASDLIYGDGATAAELGLGQIVILYAGARNGIAYKLSGALSNNLVIGW